MSALFGINLVAAMFVLLGFHVAFRQKFVRTCAARLRQISRETGAPERIRTKPGAEQGELASAFRIAGIMIMAFSFTAAAFANLIAYYTAAGTN